MNIIERYISAFIVQSVTGIGGEQPSWPYDVLKHTQMATKEPVLQEVLDIVQRSNGNSKELRVAVVEVVVEATRKYANAIKEPKHRAMYSRENGMYVFSVWDTGRMVGLVVSSEGEFELAKDKITETFPDVVFVDINAQ